MTLAVQLSHRLAHCLGFGVEEYGVQFWPYRLLAVWPWTSQSVTLNASIPLIKQELEAMLQRAVLSLKFKNVGKKLTQDLVLCKQSTNETR